MLFNSYIFVLLFLPLSLIGYFLCNRKNYTLGKAFLLGMSLWFYAYFNIQYLPIIVGSILLNYACSWGLINREKTVEKRLILLVALLANFGALFYFKYYDFFIENINIVFRSSFTLKHLVLPLGISFFTFQQVSYVIDSYKGEVPQYNMLDYALFVTYFPQLIAGPIVTHDEIVPQFADTSKKHLQFESFSKGIYAFAFGLAKKVLIADTFGAAVEWGYANVEGLNSTNAILLMLFYTIQIYFDFSGYCDMATGIGKMFNIDITENFNSPYRALTIMDFWKRWHITLTRFFTKYVYIPLGGSRKGKFRTCVNTLIVFVVSGLWHGANWTFLFWGLLHGIASVINRLFKPKIESWHPAFNWLCTFLFVNVGWVYFRANSISQGTQLLKQIGKMEFGAIAENLASPFMLSEIKAFVQGLDMLGLPGSVIFAPQRTMICWLFFAIFAVLFMKNTNERIDAFKPTIGRALTSVIVLVWCILSFAGVSVFLYFNF